jgi:isoleucyl-tRNA synthetase
MPRFYAPQFPSLFAMEESILEYWSKDQTYRKSLEKNADGDVFSFYDGPPFITGIPHYATLLPSIVKDIIPRYQTMRGKRVRRIWGWDVHGLPAENQVEKKLGLKTKKDIETLGVEKFIAACREYVGETSDAWKWYIDHIGRWTELETAYRTDDLSYMESVMAAFKQLHDKGLIYRGRRTSLYCPRCATPLSKFEVTMDEGSYKEVSDPGVTVAFQLNNDDVSLLAWTTTPWTLPANFALAVDPTAEYVKVTDGKRTFILAHQALERYRELDFEIIETFKGEQLVGWQYEPLYTFAPGNPATDFRVLAADFVTMDDGTGIVHIAPGFGEDDSRLGEANGLSLFETLTDEGHFKPELGDWAGMYYKKADPLITEDLEKRGSLIKSAPMVHSYPHCYRCSTPLIYKSQVAWYLSIEPLRALLLATNETINWLPEHLGSGRFKYNLETAPDWSLSRTRYWGSPIPVWETEDGEIFVAGSIQEIEQLSGQKVTDLHRPFIDEIELTLPNGKKAKRVKEVLDCWFESGAMPYAQDHYPFENQKVFEEHFPADFIVEYTGQLRGWFYYLHVLGNALKDSIAFKNVLVHGVVLGNDGRKMSKSYGNYPDPKATIEKYGAEAIRLFFMTSPVMRGDEVAVKEEDIRDYSRVLNVLHNSFRYFLTYAEVHDWQPSGQASTDVLDQWITVRLDELTNQVRTGLDGFDLTGATRSIRPFIEDLSTWYIRRSRDRFVAGDPAALETLHTVLVGFSVAVAPILPFTSEFMHQSLVGEASVHLQQFPEPNTVTIAESAALLTSMDQVRQIASVAHKLRADAGTNLRQPLATLAVNGFADLANTPAFIEILQDEVNVKTVAFEMKDTASWVTAPCATGTIALDTTLTPELEEEGMVREIIREAQQARKLAKLAVGQLVAAECQVADERLATILEKNRTTIMEAAGLSSLEIAQDSAADHVEFHFTS